jgi:integrase
MLGRKFAEKRIAGAIFLRNASWLRDGGADLEAVRDRLGHSNLSVTDRYLAEDKNAGDSALAALGDI